MFQMSLMISASLSGENASGPISNLLLKVTLPLKTNFERVPVLELTSFLSMKCTSGFHEIRALKLRFEKPENDRSMIGSMTITIRVLPSGFSTYENLQIVNSESARVEFKKNIRVRRGEIVYIKAEARDVRFYRFLQFDEAYKLPFPNPHFQYNLSSKPDHPKQYFINEVEYGPQERIPDTYRKRSRSRRGRS